MALVPIIAIKKLRSYIDAHICWIYSQKQKLFINVIKYLIFNKDIYHAYYFMIIFDYCTNVNVKVP